MNDLHTSLIDCVNRPFDYHPDGRVPDGNPNHTIQLIDYYDDNGVYTPQCVDGSDPVTLDAVGVMYSYGQNVIRNSTYDMTTVESRANQIYGPIYFFILSTGAITTLLAQKLNDPSAQVDNPYWSNDPVNILQITGSNNGADTTESLAQALRILSAGLRLWPTIELVTDSSTLAVSRYYGCQITPSSINNSYTDASNFYSTMRNSPSYCEFSNAQGISGRFTPLQEGSVINPMALNGLDQINNDNMDTSGLYFPVLVARLTQQVTYGATPSTSTGFPIRSFFRTILEGNLTQPTPLQATRVPYVSDWKEKLHHFNYRSDLYPSIVSGHSFKKVLKTIVQSMGKSEELKSLLNETKSALNQIKGAYNQGKKAFKIGKEVAKPIAKAFKKKRYQKRSPNSLNASASEQHEKVQQNEHLSSERANANQGDMLRIMRGNNEANMFD